MPIYTSEQLWEKLDEIEKMLSKKKQMRMFEGLLINDIVKDLKVSAEFVIKEWIETGKLPAINIGGKNRVRGGWRISIHNYIEFLEQLVKTTDKEEQKIIFINSPQQIIDNFHKGLKQKGKRKK